MINEIPRAINPCFPRSGHRFLRNILSGYFKGRFRFASTYTDDAVSIGEANYVKDHDFGVSDEYNTQPIEIRPSETYVVQIRHPILTMQSYFDFRVRHGVLRDSRDEWELFLPSGLDYWKSFALKWCLSDTSRNDQMLIVKYEDLISGTYQSVSSVVRFLTLGREKIDDQKLSAAVGRFTDGFSRFAEDEVAGRQSHSSSRDVFDFRFFDEGLCELEQSLEADFLTPLGFSRLL